MTTRKTFCSICSAFCGFEATVENNIVTAFTPDKQHPMSKGFSCTKGRSFHTLLTSDSRQTNVLKKDNGNSNGKFIETNKEEVLDEIANKLKNIIEQHGAESVALYAGNGCTFKALPMPAAHAFMRGIGSHHFYSSLTIDQPAKIIAVGRHGIWAGQGHSFESANVLMIIGNNPFVSGLHGPGSIPGWQPGALKEEKKRGLKLIVVDPRKTETAQQADIHLAIKPGTDAVLLSGMVNYILQNNLHDAAFCEQYTEGLEELKAQVEDYDLQTTADIAGLTQDEIEAAVKLFVEQQRGCVSSGTGPDMAPHGNLLEHLIYSINTLCGRHNRAGEKVATSLLTPDIPPIEGVVPFDFLPPIINPAMNTRTSRVSGARQMFNEMPTATLAEEILTPGEGQLKALIVMGGNPLLSIPQQEQIREALETVELLVVMDGRLSETAELAHYFLPTTYGLEKTDMTVFNDIFWGAPFHHISQPVVTPPDDATDEHQYLFALAKRMNIPMNYHGVDVDTANMPDDLSLLQLQFPEGSTKVKIADIAAEPGGAYFEQYQSVKVIPTMEGMEDRLRFMPEEVKQEFADLKAWFDPNRTDKTRNSGYLMICRRNPHVYNSMCHEFSTAPKHNPAFLHPDDLAQEGMNDGDTITVQSQHGAIQATAQADDTLRRGVVSISHGFGGKTGGAAVGRLLSTAETTDRYAKIPLMSAVPVKVAKA